MPQQKTNGHSGASNGCNGSNGNSYDMEDGQTFLFTSESVGEGHPGKPPSDRVARRRRLHHRPMSVPARVAAAVADTDAARVRLRRLFLT